MTGSQSTSARIRAQPRAQPNEPSPGSTDYQINRGISMAIKSGGYVTMSGELREEIAYWRFLDNWQGMLKWKDEKHLVISMSTDSSLYKWGGRVTLPQKGDVDVSHFWPDSMRNLPIMVLEAYALHNVLRAFSQYIMSPGLMPMWIILVLSRRGKMKGVAH